MLFFELFLHVCLFPSFLISIYLLQGDGLFAISTTCIFRAGQGSDIWGARWVRVEHV